MSSNWIRWYGEGNPTDYSAGASTEDDYRGEPVAQRPVLTVVPPIGTTPEPSEPPEAVLRGQANRHWHREQPTPVAPPRVDSETGWRLFAKYIRSKVEQQEKQP